MYSYSSGTCYLCKHKYTRDVIATHDSKPRFSYIGQGGRRFLATFAMAGSWITHTRVDVMTGTMYMMMSSREYYASSQAHNFDTTTTGIIEVRRTNFPDTNSTPVSLFLLRSRSPKVRTLYSSHRRTGTTQQTWKTTTYTMSAQSSQIDLRVYMFTHTAR